MSFRLRTMVAMLAVLLMSAGTLLTPSVASAASKCTDSSTHWHAYSTYTDTYGRIVPLRCGYWDGTKGWGVKKLKAKGRWNVWYRDMIGITLAAPANHWAQNPTIDIYVTSWQTDCDPVYRFRVVVNTSHRDGYKRMMGVVNAYREVQ